MNAARSFSRATTALALAAAFPSFAQVAALPQTVVTATRFAEPAQSLPLGVSVITAEEIRASGATTVNEALMRILGIVGRQDFFGGGEYNLDLRGFGVTADVNQVVVVDGLRVNEADLGGTRISGIPIESVERIEVLRGSGAVLYGEGATGGVIVITTKAGTGKDRGNSANVYAGAGSFALRDLRAGATLAGGGFSLDVAGQKRKTDNDRANFRADTDAAAVTGQWSNDWLRLGARVSADSLDTGLPGALSAAQYAADPHQSTTPNDHAHIRNDRGGVFAEAHWGSWQLAGEAGTRQKKLTSINRGFPFDYDTDATNYSLRARHEADTASGKNLLVLGSDRGEWSREVLGAFGSSASQTNQAWYAKDDFTWAGGTRISAGARKERVSKDSSGAATGLSDSLNTWELGASTPLGAGLTLYGRLGTSFRLASVDEFSFTAPATILKPQTSRDAEIGARWGWASGKAEARLYRSKLQNEIGFDRNAAGPFGFPGTNVNFDPTWRHGLELDATQSMSRTLSLRVNAAFRKATFRSGPYAGKDVSLVPRQAVSVRAEWAPAAGHRLSGGVRWVGTQHPDFANACAMPSYTTVDARYAYQWRDLELSLAVANLADKQYYTQAFGCVNGTTTSIYPEAGRALTAALRARF